MKKRLVIMLLACVMVCGCAGCGTSTQDAATAPEETETNTVSKDDAAAADDESAEADEGADIAYPTLPLPEYHYYGTEDWTEYADAVCQYLIKENFGEVEADLTMCTPVVLKVDDSDASDVKVWGEFYLDAYQLTKTSLLSTSGGSYGGLAHLDTTGEAFVVTDMEFLEDGSGNADSIKKIFGSQGIEKEYQTACDEIQTYHDKALADYINHNGLYITQYQQFGWPPVAILNAPPTKDEDQMIDHVSNYAYTAQFDMRKISASETGDADLFSGVNSEDWNDFLIEIYSESGSDMDGAIKNLKSNLVDESPALSRSDDANFAAATGVTSLTSELPYEDGQTVYVNYLIPRKEDILVVKISSTYSRDEEKQMATDEIIEAFLGSMEVKELPHVQ